VVFGAAADGVLNKVTTAATTMNVASAGHHSHSHDHKHAHVKSAKVSKSMMKIMKSAKADHDKPADAITVQSTQQSTASRKAGKSADAINVQLTQQSTASRKAVKSADAINVQSTASGKAGKSAAEASRLQSIKASPTNQGIQQILVGFAALCVGVVAVAKPIRDRRQQGSPQEEMQPMLYTSPARMHGVKA
jgi:hypothetical protein